MSDMAEAPALERAVEELAAVLGDDGGIIPVCYMNTEAAVKSICGANGGLVCTSSNAEQAFNWAYARSQRILFVPDEHLGRNTGNTLGLSPAEMIVYDPALPLGGNTEEDIRNARLILWKGYCHVHTWYSVDHIREARAAYEGARVVVHPECMSEVVQEADACGSTAFIVRYVEEAKPGDTIVIGTEANLTNRLAYEHPDKKVVALSRSLCPNMFRISLGKLRDTLVALPDHNEILLPAPIVADARLAMERMLSLA
jgi:quinolinate synthase